MDKMFTKIGPGSEYPFTLNALDTIEEMIYDLDSCITHTDLIEFGKNNTNPYEWIRLYGNIVLAARIPDRFFY
jgi:hypothetical protein